MEDLLLKTGELFPRAASAPSGAGVCAWAAGTVSRKKCLVAGRVRRGPVTVGAAPFAGPLAPGRRGGAGLHAPIANSGDLEPSWGTHPWRAWEAIKLAKSACGLADFGVCSCHGWYRHIARAKAGRRGSLPSRTRRPGAGRAAPSRRSTSARRRHSPPTTQGDKADPTESPLPSSPRLPRTTPAALDYSHRTDPRLKGLWGKRPAHPAARPD